MNRASYVLLTSAASISMAFAVVNPMPLKMVWNVSASVPIGLYFIEPAGSLNVTD
ncbi:MAG: S26 family signal peptidase, partial [Azorhizobium sp. 12-66-6]